MGRSAGRWGTHQETDWWWESFDGVQRAGGIRFLFCTDMPRCNHIRWIWIGIPLIILCPVRSVLWKEEQRKGIDGRFSGKSAVLCVRYPKSPERSWWTGKGNLKAGTGKKPWEMDKRRAERRSSLGGQYGLWRFWNDLYFTANHCLCPIVRRKQVSGRQMRCMWKDDKWYWFMARWKAAGKTCWKHWWQNARFRLASSRIWRYCQKRKEKRYTIKTVSRLAAGTSPKKDAEKCHCAYLHWSL